MRALRDAAQDPHILDGVEGGQHVPADLFRDEAAAIDLEPQSLRAHGAVGEGEFGGQREPEGSGRDALRPGRGCRLIAFIKSRAGRPRRRGHTQAFWPTTDRVTRNEILVN